MTLPGEKKVEAVAENAWLKLVGRASMAVIGILMLPLVTSAISWATATSADVNTLKERVTVLESIGKNGREDRQKFQDQTTQMLQSILAKQTDMQSQIAGLSAKLEAQQRELDRRP
ncbi:hypothetical protein [Mesorhizobium sp. WSM3859]|uniref:hypothetical protein n=1 Tax=Mesorhizobium sp. WSM3859 TaxID=2029402 RepID=UPI000BAF5150|nr:hypothetical protein [Mesorhizobium sp. WSM3859]PBC09210.1 hypothetical protein CK230_17150 [Mesorhizobium sp. WSM3859]